MKYQEVAVELQIEYIFLTFLKKGGIRSDIITFMTCMLMSGAVAIVAMGISEQLLRWKGIEATMKIAESQNAKVVIIGSGKDGLPIILDTK
jgi:hypothetical protein